MSLAQEEFDRFFSEKAPVRGHPEDQQDPSDNESSSSSSRADAKGTRPAPRYVPSDEEDTDDEFYSNTMLSKPTSYHVPTTVFDANTGPKGVIADAQSYERAKKRSFRRTLMNAASLDRENNLQQDMANLNLTQQPPDESEDERFMREWRAARIQELQRNGNTKRGPARKRKYGSVDVVSANGYLDAVENAPADTVVVVCIYDPDSVDSSIVEDCLTTIARKQPTVRFIKLHHEIADMEHIQAPALLAYKGGEVFATIVDIFQQIPDGRNCSFKSLEDLMMLHHVF
ncbi:hypothetical protein VTO42DRAFT_1864 [Malbranchea cinnamomea]